MSAAPFANRALPWFVLVFASLLTGCDQQAAFDRAVPHEEAAAAEKYLERLAARDFRAVEAGLNPRLRSPGIRAQISTLAESFPASRPTSVTLVGAQTNITPDQWRAQFTFEYAYPGQWVLAGVAMRRLDGDLVVDGINVEHTPDSVSNIHRFSFANSTPRHCGFLLAAAAVAAFVLYTLVLCIRTPVRRMKWLWVAFISLGVGTANLNWTSGAVDFVPIHVLLFSVGFQKLLYSPLIVSIAVPVGAIVFHVWLRRYATPRPGSD